MSEWIKFNLGELITIKHGYAFSGKYITSVKNNNILVTPGNFKIGGGFKADKFKYFSSDDYPKEYLFDGGELIVTMTDLSKETDTLGFVALVPKDTNKYLHNQRVGLINILDESVVDKLYLYWKLRTNEYQSFIANSASGTSVMHTSPKKIYEYSFLLPSLIEQKAIASVLSSLDNKIELLHRQNKTLESMAETLFRQWFVEEAQDDWEEVNVLNIFSLVGGGTPKTSIDEYWNGNIPWISGGDISQSHKGFISKTEKSITELGLKSSSTKLLPKFSTIISARGTVGRYAMLEQEMCFSQSNYGIIPKGHNCYYFVYLLIGFIVDELLAAAYGSIFDTITTRTFESVDLKLPEMSEIINFEAIVIEHFKKKELNSKQIQTLEKLRDTLLPKLMSGEVRVNYTPEEIKQ